MVLRCFASSASGSNSLGALSSTGARDPLVTTFMGPTRYPARAAASKSLAADEVGFARALLDEGVHPDLLVFGGEEVHEQFSLDQQAVLHVGLQAAIDRDLGGAERHQGPARVPRRDLDRFGVNLIRGYHDVDQADR